MTYALLTGCTGGHRGGDHRRAVRGVPAAAQDRQGDQHRRTGVASFEGGHADAGRPADRRRRAAFALVAAVPKDSDVWLPLAVMLVFCAIGFYDDLGTLVDREKREAHDRASMILKLVGFAVVGVVGGVGAVRPHRRAADARAASRRRVRHRPVYIVIAVFVIIATTSAVGVTDGLDMLCGGTSAVAFAAFGAIALMQHQTGVATFCFATVGALLGFLYWNAYPARIFMGDSGAIAAGRIAGRRGADDGLVAADPGHRRRVRDRDRCRT